MIASEIRRPTLLIYSNDVVGLGHLRRNIAIARKFVGDHPDANVLIFTGVPSGSIFELPYGVDIIRLPSIEKISTDQYRSRSLSIGCETLRTIRSSIVLETTRALRPDIFLVDHSPFGIWGELRPTLEMLKAQFSDTSIVLGLRDVLDEPAVTRLLWQRDGVDAGIRELFDRILVYGQRQVFDTASAYGFNGRTLSMTRYCTYLCSEDSYPDRRSQRRSLGIGNEKLVLVTAGGGGDGYPMMESCLSAFEQLVPCTSAQAIFLTGPSMVRADRERLANRAQNIPVHVLPWVDDAIGLIKAADLVITMAGYNTLVEAIRFKKRIIAIPRTGPSAEQAIRANCFLRRGLIDAVAAAGAAPGVLADLMLDLLDGPERVTNGLRVEGLQMAVDALNELLINNCSRSARSA